jgi:hypothetical protein
MVLDPSQVNIKSEADLVLLVDTLQHEIYPLCQAMESKIKRIAPETSFSADHVFAQICEYATLVHEGSTKRAAAELVMKPLKDYIEEGYKAVGENVGTFVAGRMRAGDRNGILEELNGIMSDFGLGNATGVGITGA